MRNAKLLILLYFVLGTPAFGEEQQPPATEPMTKTLMWPDGTRYVGGVVDGKRSGKGTIFWQDGTRFVGNFSNDKRNGPGTMILPDGSVYNGTFENDELIGKTPNTDTFEGKSGEERPSDLSKPGLESATTPPPQAVPLYQPVTRMDEQTRKQLESAVDGWAAAWSRQDVDDYLAWYSENFEVPGNQSRNQWEALRRSRLGRPDFISISISFEKTEIVGADEAQVTFKQTYKSNRYKDVTRKRLTLIKEAQTWRIKQERSI